MSQRKACPQHTLLLTSLRFLGLFCCSSDRKAVIGVSMVRAPRAEKSAAMCNPSAQEQMQGVRDTTKQAHTH